MSIQTYINKLADNILYRLQHLDRFSDYIYISETSINSNGINQEIFYEPAPGLYELSDILYSISDNFENNWMSLLLLYCPEHEPTRKLNRIFCSV